MVFGRYEISKKLCDVYVPLFLKEVIVMKDTIYYRGSCPQCGGTLSERNDKLFCDYCGQSFFQLSASTQMVPVVVEEKPKENPNILSVPNRVSNEDKKEIVSNPSVSSKIGKGILSAVMLTLALTVGGFAVTLFLSIISLGGLLFHFDGLINVLELAAFIGGPIIGFFMGFSE